MKSFSVLKRCRAGVLSPPRPPPAVAAHTHTHAAAAGGYFQECEPCFGVDSFSPGRALEPLSFMEVVNPFPVMYCTTPLTNPPPPQHATQSAAAATGSPSSAALAVLRMLMQYHTAPSHRTRETSGASVMLQQSLQGGVGGTVSPDCRSASGRAALVTMLGAFAIEK